VPPRAEGPSARWSLRLDAVPVSARLVVTVHDCRLNADGRGASLVLNGHEIDTLQRHIDRVVKKSLRVTIDLPPRLLQKGENTIEARQPRATGSAGRCVVSQVAVE